MRRRLRVLLVAPVPPHPSGAGAIPVLLDAELTGLSERHQVTLLTGLGDEPGEADAVAALADRVELVVADRRRPPPGRARRRRQARLAASWARGSLPWRTVWFADPSFQRQLDRLGRERAFDVVAVEDSAMSVFRFPAGVPTVFTHHEVLRDRPVDWHPGPPRNWARWAFGELDWRRWARFQPRAWAAFDLVQVFSGRDADAIASIAPSLASRVRVDPFGIVLPPPGDPAKEVPGLLLFVGNFAHPPNRDAAIWLAREIMPAVRAGHPGARLRIVGTAPPAEVRELAGEAVEVVADAPSVIPHLIAAAVVLAPVRTGGGMRMKVLQAMAAGKAVVTTPRGAEGFTGFDEEPPLRVAESAADIAAASIALLSDADERRDLGAAARAFCERHHSPAAWAERLTAVYEEARALRGRRD